MKATTDAAAREAGLRALEDRLGHRFADRALLERALTHSSTANERLLGPAQHNEPFEFLGDAIVGFLVAELLHRRDPEGDEGTKTKARAALVSAASLARHAAALDVPELLRLGRGEAPPVYVVVLEAGPAHRKRYRVECRVGGRALAIGEGHSKKEAQQDAARQALDVVELGRKRALDPGPA